MITPDPFGDERAEFVRRALRKTGLIHKVPLLAAAVQEEQMLRLAQLRDGGIPGIEDLAVLLQGLGEGEVIKIRVEVQGV